MKEYKVTINSEDELFGAMHDVEIKFASKPKKEGELWQQIGKTIVDAKIETPDELLLKDSDGKKAKIEVRFFESESPRPSYKLVENDIKTGKDFYEKKLLRNVDPSTNKKAFYNITPNSMCDITMDIGAEYGLLGTNAVEEGNVIRPFPTELYWLKYYQKLSEGYTDETELIGDEDDETLSFLFGRPDEAPEEEADEDTVSLWRELSGSAKAFLNEKFSINWLSETSPYTARQIESCWKMFADLCNSANEAKAEKAVKKANDAILKLLKVASPELKRGIKISSFLVEEDTDLKKVKDDINSVAFDWENRIRAMEAVASKKASKGENKESLFGSVAVRKATAEEFKHMQDLIRTNCPGKVGMLKEVYMLTPEARKRVYEEELEKAVNKTEKELFHGSITSNMISLISAGGPTIHVNAANGRAYGNGSYWSSDFDKSLGYTSYCRSRWANGNDHNAFMLVGKVHYGKPYFPKHGVYDAEKAVKEGGYDCCHAMPQASGFLKDEIITYDEAHSYVEAILKFGD